MSYGYKFCFRIYFFFKQKTAYEIPLRLVGSEMCIRDRQTGLRPPEVVLRAVDALQHDGLCEAAQQLAAAGGPTSASKAWGTLSKWSRRRRS